MNYYERHLGDYARDAGHLSMLEHGAYTLLLDRYYSTEHPIPGDQAHRVCRARSREERAAVDAVLAEFFHLVDGAWVNCRASREVKKAQTKIEAARNNGAKGGRPKNNPDVTEPKPNGLSLGSVLETQSKAHQIPDTRHQIPDKEKTGERARGARLPSDWSLPDGWGEWAKSERPELDPEVTACKFRDYWTAKPGASGRKLDWQATWRNWVREERTAPLRVVNGSAAEPAWRTEQRERTEAFAGPAAAKRRTNAPEIIDATPRLLG